MIEDANALAALRRVTEKVEILAGERGSGADAALRERQMESIVAQAVAAALLEAGILSGVGSPEGAVPAKVGTLYRNLSGGPGTTLYVKETGGAGPTGWVGK